MDNRVGCVTWFFVLAILGTIGSAMKSCGSDKGGGTSNAALLDQCEAALHPSLASESSSERAIARSMLGYRSGSEVVNEGGSKRVNIRLKRNRDYGCPALMTGSCVIEGDSVRVTSPLREDGYEPC